MANLSPKIEIINYFDNLIHQIDIDIDQTIENYKENQILGELMCFLVKKTNSDGYFELRLDIEYFDSNESTEKNKCETDNQWSESTKVIDYLNQVRQKTIEELRNAQEDSLEYLKSSSCDLSQLKESKDVEELKSRLFADKFYFQVFYKPLEKQISWVFNLYTIVVDFYLSPSDIELLKFLITHEKHYIRNFYSRLFLIFDEKFVLIHSIIHQFFKNVKSKQYPSHLISFRKQDLLNIKAIKNKNFLHKVSLNCSSSYLSKLESLDLGVGSNFNLVKIMIEGLSSLKSLKLQSVAFMDYSFRNMNSLKQLTLVVLFGINNKLISKLFEIFPNIESLTLGGGNFYNINFDSFVKLKKLRLTGDLSGEFNFDLFKNISNQLEELWIEFKNMDDKRISKLLYGHNFHNVSSLHISSCKITRLERKLFDRFPMLKSLNISKNTELKTIDKDAFSNLKNLEILEFSSNNKLSKLQLELFRCLAKLEKLRLGYNPKLRYFNLNIFDYIVNIKQINMNSFCSFFNEQEVHNHLKSNSIRISYSRFDAPWIFA